MTPWRVLIVDASDDDAAQLLREIRPSRPDLYSERVDTVEAMAAALDRQEWDVVLADDAVSYLDVPTMLALVNERQPDVPLIIVSNASDESQFVAWLKAGAADYLRRDRLTRLVPAIKRAQSVAVMRCEYRGIEEALHRVESNYRLLMEQTTDGISIANAQGDYQEVNAAALEMLGYSRDELLHLNVTDLFPPDELTQNPVHFDALRDGKIVISERRLRRKDGQVIIAETSARMLPDGQILAITRDITGRKHAEEQLEHYSRELAQSNEELKRFAYIVSHDLRAPLVNLKGFAAELRSALEAVHAAVEPLLPHMAEQQRAAVHTAFDEDIPEALGFIDTSVTRMDHFIGALLKLSRLGRAELNLEPIDMEALVRETLETLAHRIEERKISVTIGPLPEVIADRTSMEQIMTNILNNAVLYLDPSRPGEIEISGKSHDDFVTFRVRDNGRGIAPQDMDKVFAPFRRAGKQDVPGEGMGLAYVQTLVRRHDGRIWCESELGAGTTFTFMISNHLMPGDQYA
jgi:PAS domain S-box-containing protein